MDIAFRKIVQKRAGWLTALFLGEMLTATAMGFFEKEIAKAWSWPCSSSLIISERRQLRVASLDAGHPRAGAWRSHAARLVARDARRLARAGARRHSRHHWFSADHGVVGVFDHLRPHWMLVALVTVSVALCRRRAVGALTDRSCHSCCGGSDSIPPRRRRCVRGDAGRCHRAGDLLHGRHRRVRGFVLGQRRDLEP